MLVDCNAIHSFGMKFPLDVLFLDGKGKVLRTLRSLRPWRMPRRVSGATYVLEVPEGTIDLSGTEVGDDLTWGESASYSISVRSEGRTERRVSPAPGERSTA